MATSEIMNVTPQMAKEWLRRNTKNRRINNNAVNRYANEMINRNWTISNDAICFDENGVLTNGQHRLLAVIKSDTEQQFIISRGIPHNVAMDTPMRRSTADNLKIMTNLPDDCTNKTIVSMVKFIMEFMGIDSKPNSNCQAFLTQFETDIVNFREELGMNDGRNSIRLAPILAAFFTVYINGADCDILLKAKRAFLTGEYVFIGSGYAINRFLPMIKLSKAINKINTWGSTGRRNAFLRTIYALSCIEQSRALTGANRAVRKMPYSLEFMEKDIKNCKCE